jgi:hypothetical protein
LTQILLELARAASGVAVALYREWERKERVRVSQAPKTAAQT